MKVCEITEKLVAEFNTQVKAIINNWTDYLGVTLDVFKRKIFVSGLSFAQKNNSKAWIVDSSQAK